MILTSRKLQLKKRCFVEIYTPDLFILLAFEMKDSSMTQVVPILTNIEERFVHPKFDGDFSTNSCQFYEKKILEVHISMENT